MGIRRRNKPSVEFSTASMSDIVFLLLIYFMLTSTFVAQVGIKVDLPTSSSDKPSPGNNTVTITGDGVFAWNQTKLPEKSELIPLIEAVLTDEDQENNVITLRADRGVTMEDAAFVMSIVAENEGTIVIMTEKRDVSLP